MPVRLGRTSSGKSLPPTTSTPPTIVKGADGKFHTGWNLINHEAESNNPRVSDLPEDFLKLYQRPQQQKNDGVNNETEESKDPKVSELP